MAVEIVCNVNRLQNFRWKKFCHPLVIDNYDNWCKLKRDYRTDYLEKKRKTICCNLILNRNLICTDIQSEAKIFVGNSGNT